MRGHMTTSHAASKDAGKAFWLLRLTLSTILWSTWFQPGYAPLMPEVPMTLRLMAGLPCFGLCKTKAHAHQGTPHAHGPRACAVYQ